MLTIERTSDAIVLKLPPETTEEQLAALVQTYESGRDVDSIIIEENDLPSVGDDEFDPEVGRLAVSFGRSAKKGNWTYLKERFKSHPDYEELLRAAAGEEEE